MKEERSHEFGQLSPGIWPELPPGNGHGSDCGAGDVGDGDARAAAVGAPGAAVTRAVRIGAQRARGRRGAGGVKGMACFGAL